MKDSKTIRNEHQSFVDAYKQIQENNYSAPVVEGSKNLKDMTKTNKKGYKIEKVLVRKSNAFTALAEKYNMSPKQFGRYVEANQHLFDIPTRKKAILANKFQGFKETKEWDEFFGDLELVEMGFLGKKSKFSKYDDKNKDIIDDGKIDYKKIFKLKKGANLDKAHYEPEGEVVDETITLTKGDYASRNSPGSAYAVAKSKGFDKKIYKAGGGLGSNFLPLVNSHEPEGEELQEKDTRTSFVDKSGFYKKDARIVQTPSDEKGNLPSNPRLGFSKEVLRRKGKIKPEFNKIGEEYLEGEDLQEITTKDTKSGTKFKVRVKDKATGSSYIRFATRDKIAQLRSDPKIASVEMTDEGQTPEERGEKKAQAAGGGSRKKAKKDYDGDGKVETGSQEYLGSRDRAIKKAMKKRSVTTEETLEERVRGGGVPSNPVKPFVKPTGSVAGSGNVRGQFARPNPINKPINSGAAAGRTKTTTTTTVTKKIGGGNAGASTDSGGTSKNTIKSVSTPVKKMSGKERAQAMAKARIASGKSISDVKAANTASMKAKAAERFKAFKARRMAKEELSDWRQDLKEIMGEVEKTEGKKPKSKKMKNGVCINPDTDDEKNKYEEVNAKKIAENLGANLQSLKIEDADGNVAYEVVDLVKPDPIKENVLSEVEGTNMFPPGTQKKVSDILNRGTKFMNQNPVGRIIKKVIGSKNQGSDYGPGGKTPR